MAKRNKTCINIVKSDISIRVFLKIGPLFLLLNNQPQSDTFKQVLLDTSVLYKSTKLDKH